MHQEPIAADGSSSVETQADDTSANGVTIEVGPMSERTATVTFGGCSLDLIFDEEMREAAVADGASCSLELGAATYDVPLSGTGRLSGDDLRLDIAGELREAANGVPDGRYVGWYFTFDGARQ